MGSTLPPARFFVLAALLFSASWAAPVYAQDKKEIRERKLFDGLDKLRIREQAAVEGACAAIRAEKEEVITEDDELSKAEAELESRLKRYRAIYLRQLQVSAGRWSFVSHPVRDLAQRIHTEIESKLADASGDEEDVLYGRAEAWIHIAYADREVAGDARPSPPSAFGERLWKLAQEISQHDPGHRPLPPIETRELRLFCVGAMQRSALAEYKRIAVAGSIHDPRTGGSVDGQTRTLIAGNALKNLSEYLASRGKDTSDLEALIKPRKKQIDIAIQLKSEIEAWKEYRLATVLDAGLEPPIKEYFLAVAQVIRFEESRVDDWFVKDYVGGKPWDVGLGKLMRANNAWGTGDASADAVRKRIAKFKAESDIAVRALQDAARTPRPEDLREDARQLLEAKGYIVSSAGGRKAYAIPTDARALSRAVGETDATLDLPGASWLDVITPKSVGIMIISVIVPEMVALEAEAMVGVFLTSERGIMAARVLVEIGADVVVSGSLEAITMKKEERASIDQLLLESAVLGAGLRIVGGLGHEGIRAGLRKIAQSERKTVLHGLMRNKTFARNAELYIAESFELVSENGITTAFQAYVNDQDVDWDTIRSTLLQGAVSRRIAKTWERAPSQIPSKKELIHDHSPDWLRKRLVENETFATQFTRGVRRRLEAVAAAKRLAEAALAVGQGPEARRLFHALVRGDLTRRELNRVYADDPERWGPVAKQVAEMISTYFFTMVREARVNAFKKLDGWHARKQRELTDTLKEPALSTARREVAERYAHERDLLKQEPIAPGSMGPTSDIDRSSASLLLRRELKAMYEMRAKWYSDGEVPTAARALDGNEYSNVMPFIKECRGYAIAMRGASTNPKEGLPRTHADAKEAISISMLLADRDPAEVKRYLRRREVRIEKEILETVPAPKRIAERKKRLKKNKELVDAAMASIANTNRKMAELAAEVRTKYPEAADSEIDIRVRDKLYDQRMQKVNDLQFDLARMQERLGKEHGESIALRAEIDRRMSIAMRDGIETYSQPAGIDILVNQVQSSEVRGKDGKMRKATVADRLADPNFTLKRKLKMYSEQDMTGMLNDQYKFILEHAHGFRTGHETPYEAGRGLGKYIERAFLARKIMGLDIAAVRKKPIYDPERRLLEVSEKLLANKNDPDALRKVLADFATTTPADAQNGVIELLRVMDRGLPGLERVNDLSALGDARGPNPGDTDNNPVYKRARMFTLRRRDELRTLLVELAGSARLAEHLAGESGEIKTELAAVRSEIKMIESLSKEFLASDWPLVLKLQQRLDGVLLVTQCLPWAVNKSEIGRGLINERLSLDTKLRDARARFKGSEPDDPRGLYDRLPRYAWAKDRENYLLWLQGRLKEELPAAKEAARQEAKAVATDLSGDWFLVSRLVAKDGTVTETTLNRVRITHEGDEIRLVTVWDQGEPYVGSGFDDSVFGFAVVGEYRRGRIVGRWAERPVTPSARTPDAAPPPLEPADPDKKPDGIWEAHLEPETMTVRVSPRSLDKDPSRALLWSTMSLVRRPDPELVDVVKRYQNGKKRLTYRVRRPRNPGKAWDHEHDGILDGPYSTWSEQGDQITHGTYAKGVRHGEWVELVPRSVSRVIGSGTYANGLRHGKWVWRLKGRVFSSATYRWGVSHGPATFAFDTKMRQRIDATGTYREGVLYGASSSIYRGDLRMTSSLVCGFAHGPTAFPTFDDGVRSGEFRFETRQGEWTTKSATGVLSSREIYSDGLLDGVSTNWLDAARKSTEGRYSLGLRTGDWTQWRETGTKETVDHHEAWPTRPSATFLPPEIIRDRIQTTSARLGQLEKVRVLDDAFTAMIAALAGAGVSTDLVDGDLEQGNQQDPNANLRVQRRVRGWSGSWQVRTRNGTLQMEASFYMGSLVGLTRWHKGGRNKAFQMALNPDGIVGGHTWAHWRADGTLLSRARFSRRGYLDSLEEWHADGKTLSTLWEDGIWSVHDPSGKRQFDFRLRNGCLTEYRGSYEVGGARYSAKVRAREGALTEMEITPEAQPGRKTLLKFGREVYSGTRTEFDEKERPKTRKSWREGLRHGEQLTWTYDRDGRLESRKAEIYERDKRTGSKTHYVRWSRDGKKLEETYYQDGRQHGPARTWHENGRMRTERAWVDDRPVGVSRKWHENGKPASVESLDEQGKQDGTFSYWNNAGQLTREVNYRNGKLNGEWIDFQYKDGKLASKRIRVFENNKLVGDKTIEAPAR